MKTSFYMTYFNFYVVTVVLEVHGPCVNLSKSSQHLEYLWGVRGSAVSV